MPLSTNRRRLLLASAATPAFSASAAPGAEQDVELYIVSRSREWTRSYTTGVTDVMEKILAADFVSTSPRGQKSDKAACIASAKEGPSLFESTQAGPIVVKVHANMALAFGGDVLVLKSGAPREVKTAWTDTWILRRDEWVVVASHESLIQPG